jgi:hypothetical protein
MISALFWIAVATQTFRFLDQGLRYFSVQKPYYAVHVLHNVAIVGLTATNVRASFANFHHIGETEINWWAVYLCAALHFYHIIDYWPALRFDDWLHHGLMIGFCLPAGCLLPAGALMGTALFFTTGLPGALSYALLVAERNDLLAKPFVQRWNARVQLWIRAPGCVAIATLIAVYGASREDATALYLILTNAIAAFTAWNGLYFAEQAIAAGARSVI